MGLLGNLLFGNRNKYNATVDDILNSTLQIETDNRINPNFSGVITYLGLIDEGWHHKASAQDTAIHIAIAYYMGMVKSDSDSDRKVAQALYPRLRDFIASSLSTRCVSEARADQFLSVIEKYKREYSTAQTTKEPRAYSGNNRITEEVDKDRLWKEAKKKAEEQSAACSSVTVGLVLTDEDLYTHVQALSALVEGNYTAALRLFRPLAEQGHANSQYNLGRMYALGQGVQQDYTEAAKWYRKAAEQGQADSQYNLDREYGRETLAQETMSSPESTQAALKATYGDDFYSHDQALSAYERGDYVTAFPIFKALAEEGDTRFHVGLGVMYMHGQGTPQNFDEAVRWFRKAADQGYALAQSWLATMYSKGMGVPLDQVLAYKWLNLAVKYWDASDVKGRVYVMHQLTLVTSSMNPEQISAGQNLVREWRPRV